MEIDNFDFDFVIESIREGKYNNSNLDSDIWLERIKFCKYLRRKNVDILLLSKRK